MTTLDTWDIVAKVEEKLGKEKAYAELLQALSRAEIRENFKHIARKWSIPLYNASGDGDEDDSEALAQ